MPSLQVSRARLWDALEEYARFGATPDGGVTRPIFSPAEQQARAQLLVDCTALGLSPRLDAAANVLCVYPGTDNSLPSILIGSHLDSVPNGGKYDGPLGTLCALEVLRTLQERHIATRHPIGLVSFTGEEGTPYGTSTFGSRALAGRLPDLSTQHLPDGRSVPQALAEAGGNWAALPGIRAEFGPIACFMEIHIEQGTRLESAGQALGVVSGACGIVRQRMVFRGEAGHAGTTGMRQRHDALRAAARCVLAIANLPAAIASDDADAVATVGTLHVAPNNPNVIPGEVALITDLRSADAALLGALATRAEHVAQEAASMESTAVTISPMLHQAPATFDVLVRKALRLAVSELGGSMPELASLAGHDAVHVGSLAPSGMLFVRCAGGLSHRPEEAVTPEDAALAAEALLRAVLLLDAKL